MVFSHIIVVDEQVDLEHSQLVAVRLVRVILPMDDDVPPGWHDGRLGGGSGVESGAGYQSTEENE